ncbi:HipA domain-containing protein [Rhodobacter sp. KR11]|uniref:HipA domain-containing protein n=1 Tax=Rhodobacter sp. KR11 TaxID=2974588 RepID=UPI002222E02B|nr:HipA domain-containing protein [Rhodobacter sp. KR11]MCW1918038.1 HipA domain-containing protein [Rhodobacter sp. KR11]
MLELDVQLEGKLAPIGRLTRRDDGVLSFRYLSDDLPHPISLSLPLREAPFGDAATRGFFANLLFENRLRDQVAERHGLDLDDIVGLLFHMGRDCPGAISCVPLGEGPAKTPGDLTRDYDALSVEHLTGIITSLRDHRRLPDATPDPSPVAGVQGKIALTRLPDGRFALPKPGLNVPTTHILKVPRRGAHSDVGLEHRATQIMASLIRHPVQVTEVLGEGDLQSLLITRFDRVTDGMLLRRLHQEDFAQALGLAPSLKYQRNGSADHCFSARALAGVLAQTQSPGPSRAAFLQLTMANVILGNTDNHAKNHALIYRGARPELAPAYDIFPTLIDPTVTHQLSFDHGGAQMADDMTPDDLKGLVLDLGFPRLSPALHRELVGMAKRAAVLVAELQGPKLKPLGDAMAEGLRALRMALAEDFDIPERDALVINRP